MRRLWDNHALGAITFGIMLVFAVAYFPSQYAEWATEQRALGQPVLSIWSWEYLNYWANRWLEAVQGESYQIWATILLTKWWIERNSAESRDSDDEVTARLQHIEEALGLGGEDHEREVQQAAEQARYHKPWRWLLPILVGAVSGFAVFLATQIWP